MLSSPADAHVPTNVSYWNWTRSWSEPEAGRLLSTVIHTANISQAHGEQPETLLKRQSARMYRKTEETSDESDRQAQAHADRSTATAVEWLACHTGEKPRHWVSHELSKRCDQVCFCISPRSEPKLSVKRVFGENQLRPIHLTFSLDHFVFRTVNPHLTPLHTKSVSADRLRVFFFKPWLYEPIN